MSAPPTMTLRDMFAAQSLASMTALVKRLRPGDEEVVAKAAYAIADAMIVERDVAAPQKTAADERAAIVAWLKTQWQGRSSLTAHLAEQIEAGAHLL